MFRHRKQASGFSLIEVVIVSALMTLVFGALFASFEYSLKLISLSRAKQSAMSIANDRMEYFRSLPYDDVGTLLGIPPGTIPQHSTTTLNGIDFAERVLVEYVDDPADGLAALDGNSIPSDYKRVKLEYTWNIGGTPGSVVTVSNIVPRSIETTAGGGTARINVIDHASQLLPGASVRLINTTLGIDVTRLTDLTGAAIFSGAPAGSDYEVVVTGPIGGFNYSLDQTYVATTSNPNPITAPFTVVAGDVSTLTFQIGQLSDLSITLLDGVTEDAFDETFADLSGIASSTAVESNGSGLVLTNVAGVYQIFGEAYLNPVRPATLEKWHALTIASAVPNNTTYRVYLLTGAGPYTLIPESDLPGNAAGFNGTTIDISTLDPVTYPELVVGVVLETSDTALTPVIDNLSLFYRESHTVLGNEGFILRGTKLIGTSTSSAPIYKLSTTTVTNTNGEVEVPDLEFDLYTIELAGAYDVVMGCPGYPFIHEAGVDGVLELVVGPDATHSLRVNVIDAATQAVPGATAVLMRAGYNETRRTGVCGEVYFPGQATAEVDYTLTVSAPGYQSTVVTDLTIDGDVFLSVTLNPV